MDKRKFKNVGVGGTFVCSYGGRTGETRFEKVSDRRARELYTAGPELAFDPEETVFFQSHLLGRCCEKAVPLDCVCMYAWKCPEHREKHVGTHD